MTRSDLPPGWPRQLVVGLPKAGETSGARASNTQREHTAANTASGPRPLVSLCDPDSQAVRATRVLNSLAMV